MKKQLKSTVAFVCVVTVLAGVQAQAQQTEEEFQQLMPITGTVETFFGDFQLDHSFPAVGEAEKIYDLMDHQRATQLYLWGIPLVGMTRWHQGYVQAYEDYDYNTLLSAKRYNERRGVLTANETTHYFWGFGNTSDAALILEVPEGLAVGMVNDMWQQSPTDLGIFGPNAGRGDHLVIVGPNTPADKIPEPADGEDVHRIDTNQVYYLMRMLGKPEDVEKAINKVRIYNYGQKPTIHILDGADKFVAMYQPRGLVTSDLERAERGSKHEGVRQNADGSTPIFIGPKAPKGREDNWVKSVPGRAWFPYFRFYGPTGPFFDQSWKLPHIEEVDFADFAK